jgi:hypothetical protein
MVVLVSIFAAGGTGGKGKGGKDKEKVWGKRILGKREGRV